MDAVRRFLTPSRLAAVGLVLLALAVAILFLVPSDDYLFLPNEAKPVAPLVSVAGRQSPEDDGQIYFVDVLVRRASVLERLFPGIHDGASLVSKRALNPTGLSDAARRRTSLNEMDRSEQIAAAVALRQAGYTVDADPAGALIEGVIPDTPAATTLRPTDVVVEANGRRVRTPGDLRRALESVAPGDEVALAFRRGDEREQVRLRTIAARGEPKRAAIGVFVSQAAEIKLPLDVRIDAGPVGGPSAGLPFALEVLEKLGKDADHGLDIAATGEIELDGSVGPVGGLKQKTIAAKDAGVDLFLVPAGENAAEARRHANGLRIVPVRTFQQALRALATAAG
ncbi:MAG TPA: S16 family serine protease [Gaiellaceae bacterium]|nr:S16 family serine protease [Gaiellaceae bacterium]